LNILIEKILKIFSQKFLILQKLKFTQFLVRKTNDKLVCGSKLNERLKVSQTNAVFPIISIVLGLIFI
jgi:hypothetical protein